MSNRFLFALLLSFALAPLPSRLEALTQEMFDVVIKGGTVYDGTGEKPRVIDVAIRRDRIVGLGDFPPESTHAVIDAKGLAVAPGFINMLSWSTDRSAER